MRAGGAVLDHGTGLLQVAQKQKGRAKRGSRILNLGGPSRTRTCDQGIMRWMPKRHCDVSPE